MAKLLVKLNITIPYSLFISVNKTKRCRKYVKKRSTPVWLAINLVNLIHVDFFVLIGESVHSIKLGDIDVKLLPVFYAFLVMGFGDVVGTLVGFAIKEFSISPAMAGLLPFLDL